MTYHRKRIWSSRIARYDGSSPPGVLSLLGGGADEAPEVYRRLPDVLASETLVLHFPETVVAWRTSAPRGLRFRLDAVRDAARVLHREAVPQGS